MELNKKYDASFLQSQEIEKLRLHVKDTATVLAERDSLMVIYNAPCFETFSNFDVV